MANLNFNEKQLFEKLFDRGGYVLDFSDRTFADFFKDFNIDICSKKYTQSGSSKMKRLRAFWEIEPDKIVGEVLLALLQYAEIKESVSKKDKDLAIIYINKLRGVQAESSSTNAELSENDFLKEKFEEINLSLLNLGDLKEIIEQRIEEIRICLKSNASLAVVFLCGSTLEGILLNKAIKNPKDFNTAKAAPKNKENKVKVLSEWTLNDLINVAYEKQFISLNVKNFSHSLREFRNYIHPREQQLFKFNPDQQTAEISWHVLQSAIDNLGRKNNDGQ
ncbi:MAG: hypothetical protein JXK07_12490 [Spirochaetes bacterium]|nr:hypothetical protein [Spirochaetota bacterium]MBN2771517.1 hypothetical protein [Spirochaetota bacterium]